MQFRRVILPLAAALALGGCASYRPLPLPLHARSPGRVALLTMPAKDFETPGVHIVRLDPAKPLDANAVAALAVLNDPALRAARAQRGVAGAQSYAAGLLPWPTLGLGGGHPAPAGEGGSAWSLALDQNIAAMLQHAARQGAARDDEERVRLDVVWDEWQVAQQARLIYADLEMINAERSAMAPLGALYAAELDAAAKVRHGNISDNDAARIEAGEAAVAGKLDALEIKYRANLAAMHRLLGLAPGVTLRLALDDHPAPPDARRVNAALAALTRRRPDLMALAAAYRQANQRLRQAVAAQFPLIGVSLHRKKDIEGVIENGFSLTLDLPFLGEGRGTVALARASRLALHTGYEARLQDATSRARSLGDETRRLQTLLRHRRESMKQLPTTPTDDSSGAVPFRTLAAYAARRAQVVSTIAELQYSLDEATVALQTLLGIPLGGSDRTESI